MHRGRAAGRLGKPVRLKGTSLPVAGVMDGVGSSLVSFAIWSDFDRGTLCFTAVEVKKRECFFCPPSGGNLMGENSGVGGGREIGEDR